jgi:hypothetical protein
LDFSLGAADDVLNLPFSAFVGIETAPTVPIPEPSTLLLLGLGLAGILLLGKKRFLRRA